MHNLNRSSHDVDHGIRHTKKWLSDEKKNFIDNQNLRQHHINYDMKAANGSLNTLTPKWTEAQIDERQTAYGLYSPSRPIIRNHWEELERRNGNVSIICPFCGLTDAEEMDHFVPRGKERLFPEYATHYSNLIPLCHNCNHTKGDEWTDRHGRQIFFNAYFDDLDGIVILKCEIMRNATTGIISSKVNLNIDGSESDVCRRIVNTINHLGLIKRYTKESNKVVRSKITDYTVDYETSPERYRDKDDFITTKRTHMRVLISRTDDFITKLTYDTIAESDIFWEFIKSKLA